MEIENSKKSDSQYMYQRVGCLLITPCERFP